MNPAYFYDFKDGQLVLLSPGLAEAIAEHLGTPLGEQADEFRRAAPEIFRRACECGFSSARVLRYRVGSVEILQMGTVVRGDDARSVTLLAVCLPDEQADAQRAIVDATALVRHSLQVPA